MYNIKRTKRLIQEGHKMNKSVEIEFKSMLTEQEYNKLMEKFHGNRTDLQTNHYFDTPRFSLKAASCSLRVRERDGLELTLKRKKGYSIQESTIEITQEQFESFKNTGVLPSEEAQQEIQHIIGEQKLNNFLSLSTLRMYLPYKTGILFIDKSMYFDQVDYELEYEAKSYYQGRKEFVEIINELGIQYKKADKKIRRAYNAFKRMH